MTVRTTKPKSGTWWVAVGVIGAAFLYLTALAHAVDLGAARHDAFCPEHGWARR